MADKKIIGRIKIIPARRAHIKYLAANMRAQDKDEVMASAQDAPAPALEKSFNASTKAFTAFFEGLPLCMFGVCAQGFLSGRAVVWLLGTDKIKECRKDFCKATLYFIQEFLKDYDALFNYVDARYKSAIRWLKFAGAEFGDAKPYGKARYPFKCFEIRRNLWEQDTARKI
jgi:hypothetical protein